MRKSTSDPLDVVTQAGAKPSRRKTTKEPKKAEAAGDGPAGTPEATLTAEGGPAGVQPTPAGPRAAEEPVGTRSESSGVKPGADAPSDGVQPVATATAGAAGAAATGDPAVQAAGSGDQTSGTSGTRTPQGPDPKVRADVNGQDGSDAVSAAADQLRGLPPEQVAAMLGLTVTTAAPARMSEGEQRRWRHHVRAAAGKLAAALEDAETARAAWLSECAAATEAGYPVRGVQGQAYDAGLPDSELPESVTGNTGS